MTTNVWLRQVKGKKNMVCNFTISLLKAILWRKKCKIKWHTLSNMVKSMICLDPKHSCIKQECVLWKNIKCTAELMITSSRWLWFFSGVDWLQAQMESRKIWRNHFHQSSFWKYLAPRHRSLRKVGFPLLNNLSRNNYLYPMIIMFPQCWRAIWGLPYDQSHCQIQWSHNMDASCQLQVCLHHGCYLFPFRPPELHDEVWLLDVWW